jgi:hypothetical protein
MQKVSVTLPQEDLSIIEFTENELPGLLTVNAALKDFSERMPFAWHLSVMVVYKNTVNDNMPSKTEQELLVQFEEQLDKAFKKDGNALFLANITHNGSKELIWRVHNPEIPNDYLHDLIESEDHPRPFEFTLEQDVSWAKAKWPFSCLEQDGEKTKDKPLR